MLRKGLSLYKTSFTGLSKETWLLSFVMLVNRSGTMVVPFMTLYLTSQEMNRSLSEAGFVMSLFGIGSIVGAFFGGKLSDKIGFNKIQLISLLGGGILFIVLGQLKSYPLICVFTFLLSMVNEAFRPANSAAIAYYSHAENRTRSYSLNRLSVNLGWAVGASIGGIIAARNYELLFWVDGLTNICAAFLLLMLLKPVSIKPKHEQPHEKLESSLSPYHDKVYLFFIGLVTVFGLCFFQLFSTVPKYFRDDLYLKEDYIGMLMAINGVIIVAIEMVLIYTLEQKKKNMFYIIVGIVICSLSYFSLLLPINAVAITLVMILFITFGEIMSMPFMNTYWTIRSNDKNRGQYAALYTMAWGLAQTIGPFIFSALVDATNFKVMFATLGVLLLLTAYGFHRISKVI